MHHASNFLFKFSLSKQIDELKNLAVRDTDDDVFALRNECTQLREDGKTVQIERDALQQNIDQKEHLIRKYEYEMKGQAEMVTHLNNQVKKIHRSRKEKFYSFFFVHYSRFDN